MMAALTRLCKSRSAVLCGHHQGPTRLYRSTSTVRLAGARERRGATACFACSPRLADDSGPRSRTRLPGAAWADHLQLRHFQIEVLVPGRLRLLARLDLFFIRFRPRHFVTRDADYVVYPRFTTNAAGRPLKALYTMCRFEVLVRISAVAVAGETVKRRQYPT